MAQLCVLWTKSAQLSGSCNDDMVPDGLARDMAEDWALIDAVVRCYPELEGAKKTVKSGRTLLKLMLAQRLLPLFSATAKSTYGM